MLQLECCIIMLLKSKKKLCLVGIVGLSVGRSVGCLFGWSVGVSVGRSVGRRWVGLLVGLF